jgi:class 3 adenylate cyclase
MDSFEFTAPLTFGSPERPRGDPSQSGRRTFASSQSNDTDFTRASRQESFGTTSSRNDRSGPPSSEGNTSTPLASQVTSSARTFARLSDFAGARNVAKTLRNKQPDIPLLSGRESNTADLVAFDDFYSQLRRLDRKARDPLLNPTFWDKLRALLSKFQEPLGFTSLPGSEQCLPISDHLLQKFLSRVFEHLSSILPLQPDALADKFGIPEEDIVNQLLLATRVGLVGLRYAVECRGCKGDLGQVAKLGDLCQPKVRCPLCEIHTDVTSLDQVKVRFFLHNDVLYCPMHNVPCTRKSPAALAKTHLLALVPATESGSGFSFQSNSILPKGLYQFRCQLAEYEQTLEVLGDADERTTPCDLSLRLSTLRQGVRHDCYNRSNKFTVPHGKINYNMFPDTGAIFGIWVMKHTDTREADFSLPKELAERFVPASRMINHPLFVRAFPNERLHPDVVLNVGAVAIVAVQICDFDRLLNSSGDVETLKRIREVRSAVARAFEAYGRHVKSADKWILGAFASPADAVLAGGNAFLAVTATQRDARAPIQIKCGVHVGPVAIATSDGAIDIFGKAVAMSQQVARSGDAFSLQVSDETAAAIPDLRSLLLDGSQSLRGGHAANAMALSLTLSIGSVSMDVSPHSVDNSAHVSSTRLASLTWLGSKFTPI